MHKCRFANCVLEDLEHGSAMHAHELVADFEYYSLENRSTMGWRKEFLEILTIESKEVADLMTFDIDNVENLAHLNLDLAAMRCPNKNACHHD